MLHIRHPPNSRHGVIVPAAPVPARSRQPCTEEAKHPPRGYHGGAGEKKPSQAFATAAHGLRADEEELALGYLHDLGRVGIVCDGMMSVPGCAISCARGLRTPDFA